MKKWRASITKEFLVLWHDKIGLSLLFLMPLLLVFVITIVQNSAFQLVGENKMDILVVNHDKGQLASEFIALLEHAGSFRVEKDNRLMNQQLMLETIKRKKLISIVVPSGFTKGIRQQSLNVAKLVLSEFGALEKNDKIQKSTQDGPQITIYYDPVLQENFRFSLFNGINNILAAIKNEDMLNQMFVQMGETKIPNPIKEQLSASKLDLQSKPATTSGQQVIPNATQHNVPAWAIFAMFFMVISLGGNLVKERLVGSFVRLKMVPSAFSYAIAGKMSLFLFVALIQLILIFSMGVFVFPLIGLPALEVPTNVFALVIVSILSAWSAISYALLIGTYAQTQEQANGFGAVSVIVFAAIGGIWVPSFIMPQYLQMIGKLSPLHWCIEGYYSLFLKHGNWNELGPTFIYLLLFIFVCHFLTFVKLKAQNFLK